ncbi:hypothetical protein ACQPZJ_01645 [Actinoplanes sp. CA-054009]
MTRVEVLAAAHREAARAIRTRLDDRAAKGHHPDWESSEQIRAQLAEIAIRHIEVSDRLEATARRAATAAASGQPVIETSWEDA